MKHWKYGTKKTISQLTSAELDEYGKIGWELVSVVYCELVGYTYYFKQEYENMAKT